MHCHSDLDILVVFLVVMAGMVREVHTSSLGARPAACASMAVGHQTSPQPHPAPYTVSTSSSTYGCGHSVLVTVDSKSTAFRGFLCQARHVWNVYQTYGSIAPNIGTSATNNCDNDGSITHADPSEKTSVSFLWKPPSENVGSICIICTIVKDYSTHWRNVSSPEMTFSEQCQSTVNPDSTTSATSAMFSTTSSTFAQTGSTMADQTPEMTTMSEPFTTTSAASSASTSSFTNVTDYTSSASESTPNTSTTTVEHSLTTTSSVNSGTRLDSLATFCDLFTCMVIAYFHVKAQQL